MDIEQRGKPVITGHDSNGNIPLRVVIPLLTGFFLLALLLQTMGMTKV